MSNRLQQLRWARNWSQAKLERVSGVPQSVISNIENKNTEPGIITALRLARALKVSVEELFQLS